MPDVANHGRSGSGRGLESIGLTPELVLSRGAQRHLLCRRRRAVDTQMMLDEVALDVGHRELASRESDVAVRTQQIERRPGDLNARELVCILGIVRYRVHANK